MDTNTSNDQEKKPTLLQQLMGAVMGGSLALVVYYAYDYGAPVVQSWLIQPEHQASLGQNRIADKDFDDSDERHIQSQARRIASAIRPVPEYTQEQDTELLAQHEEPESVEEPPDDNATIWEEAWTGDDVEVEEASDDTESFFEEPVEEYVPPPPPEPITSIDGEPVPALPDSGLGLLLLIGTAGAGAGASISRRKSSALRRSGSKRGNR